jgi:hypothetical protein
LQPLYAIRSETQGESLYNDARRVKRSRQNAVAASLQGADHVAAAAVQLYINIDET